MDNLINFLKLRQIKILFISLIIESFIIFIIPTNQFIKFYDSILSSYSIMLSVSASLFGFLITFLSILLMFPEEGRVKLLKKDELYIYVFYCLLFSILTQLLLFIFCVLGTLFGIILPYQNKLYIIIIIFSISTIFLDLWILKNMIDVLQIKD